MIRNPRGETAFTPTERARASLLIPIECDRRTERLYLERGTPKSAHLVRKGEEFFLHFASEVEEAPAANHNGSVLALQRGITTLVSAVVLDRDGKQVASHECSDKGLAALVTTIGNQRAVKQQQGRLTTGDRRLSRITTEHLHLIAHELVEVARTHEVQQIVVLADSYARRPQRFLAYKHWSELQAVLSRCCALAGVPAPALRKIYGKSATCPACGELVPKGPLPSERRQIPPSCTCGRQRTPDQSAILLGLDTLRFRGRVKPDATLGEWIKKRQQKSSSTESAQS